MRTPRPGRSATENSSVRDPIFVVGCPRSGTTLLQRILNAHSEIAIAPETHFLRRFWFRRSHYGDLRAGKNYGDLLNDICAMPEFSEMGLREEEFTRAAENLTRDYRSLFGLLLEQFRNAVGAKYAGEKTPNHLLYATTLQSFFPHARFIHIVRDPRAVVNSWRGVPWSTGTLGGDAAVWRRYQEAASQYTTSTLQVLTVSYEGFVANADKVANDICVFLGVTFEPEMINTSPIGLEVANPAREPWKEKVLEPITTGRSGAWRAELSRDEVAIIESVVWPEMRRYGYKADAGVVRMGLRVLPRVIRRKLRALVSGMEALE